MTLTRDFTKAKESQPARFDWYAATVVDGISGEALSRKAAGSVEAATVPVRPGHGFGTAVQLKQGTRVVGMVQWGGIQQHPHLHGSGSTASVLAAWLRDEHPQHRVARADVAIDFDDPGAWEAVAGATLRVARARGIRKEQLGDWLDPHRTPGEGRTLRVGARTSAVLVRTYEKGRQLPEAGRPDWVRAEVQVRPQKAAKAAMAVVEPLGFWGSAKWTQELAEELLSDAVPAARVITWREPDELRARVALMRQYGGVIDRWLAEYGGDWSVFGEVFEAERRSL